MTSLELWHEVSCTGSPRHAPVLNDITSFVPRPNLCICHPDNTSNLSHSRVLTDGGIFAFLDECVQQGQLMRNYEIIGICLAQWHREQFSVGMSRCAVRDDDKCRS